MHDPKTDNGCFWDCMKFLIDTDSVTTMAFERIRNHITSVNVDEE